MSIAQVKEALRQEREGEKPATGAPNEILRSLFDEFVESAVEGLRLADLSLSLWLHLSRGLT